MYGSGDGTTPACAGTTASDDDITALLRDHPRVRGDHDPATALALVLAGPPPRARGPHGDMTTATHLDGTTPACAGTTGQAAGVLTAPGDHPRVRGDHGDSGTRHGAG